MSVVRLELPKIKLNLLRKMDYECLEEQYKKVFNDILNERLTVCKEGKKKLETRLDQINHKLSILSSEMYSMRRKDCKEFASEYSNSLREKEVAEMNIAIWDWHINAIKVAMTSEEKKRKDFLPEVVLAKFSEGLESRYEKTILLNDKPIMKASETLEKLGIIREKFDARLSRSDKELQELKVKLMLSSVMTGKTYMEKRRERAVDRYNLMVIEYHIYAARAVLDVALKAP